MATSAVSVSVLDEVQSTFPNVLFEMVLVVAFVVGFLVHRKGQQRAKVTQKQNQFRKIPEELHDSAADVVVIDDDIRAAGENSADVVRIWRAFPEHIVEATEVANQVLKSYLKIEPSNVIDEVVERLAQHRRLGNFASSLLDILCEHGNLELVEAVVRSISDHSHFTHHMNEAVASAYANAGEEDKLANWFNRVLDHGLQRRITARAYSLVVRGFLHAERPEAALRYAKEMLQAGFSVSPFLVTKIFRVFCKVGRAADALEKAMPEILPNCHAGMIMFDHCLHAKDVKVAEQLEVILKKHEVEIHPKSYEAYIKLLVGKGDGNAIRVLREMHKEAIVVPEGFCASLLCRAAEAKFIGFAEDLVDFVKKEKGMTVTLYGALMKVYSCTHNFEKACDLYYKVVADGLQPDQLMLSCLMKYAIECNRVDLIAELEEQVSKTQVTQWSSMLRNARQEKDAEKAFSLLKRQEALGQKPDTSAYNYVLDACIGAGSSQRAAELVGKMLETGCADIVTYNTMLKVFAKSTDLQGAKSIFKDIEAAGLQPDVVSYNILMNIAINGGNIKEAWDHFQCMKEAGVQPDGYTVSTMFKAAKKMTDRKDIDRVFELLDCADVDLTKDEVLMNCVLEACVKFNDRKRVSQILEIQEKSGTQPAFHSYGVLIRAAGFANNAQRCRELWQEMVEMRRFTPSEVIFGCMVSSLVFVGCADEAFALVRDWKTRVAPNQVVYAILLRGFADSNRPDKSLEVVQEMNSLGLPVSNTVYGRLLECFVRLKEHGAAEQLLQQMEQDGIQCTDPSILSTLAKWYCSTDDLDKCSKLLRNAAKQDQRKGDRKAETVAFDRLLDRYIKAGRYAEASRMVDDMDEYGIKATNFTLASVVTLWGCTYHLDKAFKAVEMMTSKYAITPNALVRTCLLKACVQNDDLSRAFRVFDVIKSTNEGADSKAFEAMIAGCVQVGWHLESARLLEEACGLSDVLPNFSPKDVDMKVVESVARSLSKAGLMTSVGAPLFKRLRGQGIILSNSVMCGSAW